jgi:hypothetical protein
MSASVLIELDDRRRVSLGKLGHHARYLASEQEDGTIILEPAVVLTEAEARFLTNSELVATIEENRQHPERSAPRPRRHAQT